MGDVIRCTRFLSRAEDLVPLPSTPMEVPRIPLFSVEYRIGSLLDVLGEKTTEQHVMNALEQTILQWKRQGLPVGMCDFTSYPKLDAFPPQYVIFLELSEENSGSQMTNEHFRFFQNSVDAELERQLCLANHYYKAIRDATKLAPLRCILVRKGTFSTFIEKKFATESVSPTQIKQHRLLKHDHHIQFFYDNQIDTSSF